MSVLVTSLHGDVHQSGRVSVLWAKPYRVCQCECLSVCVLVSVSLIGKAGARPEWMGPKSTLLIAVSCTHAPFVCLGGERRPIVLKPVRTRVKW